MSMRTGADGLPQWQVIWLCAKAEGAIAATRANATILIAILIEAPPGPISISRYFPISTRVNVPGTGLGSDSNCPPWVAQDRFFRTYRENVVRPGVGPLRFRNSFQVAMQECQRLNSFADFTFSL